MIDDRVNSVGEGTPVSLLNIYNRVIWAPKEDQGRAWDQEGVGESIVF